MKKYEHLPAKYLKAQFERWERVLTQGMVGNLFFAPRSGMAYRLSQFGDYLIESNKDVAVVDVASLSGEVWTIGEELGRQKSKQIVVNLRKSLLSADGWRVGAIIEKFLLDYEGGIVLVHELVPSQLKEMVGAPSFLLRQQMIYRLPEEMVVKEYILIEAQESGLTVTTDWINEVYNRCGNQLWLVNELVRAQVEEPNKDLVELALGKSYLSKIAAIWRAWPKEWREGIGVQDKEILSEMSEVGVIDCMGEIVSSDLRWYVKEQLSDRLEITQKYIRFGDLDYTHIFTPGEKELIARLHARKMVEREEVARVLWGGEEQSQEASDWAIDQRVRRLRSKLVKNGLPLTIVTKKGLGYAIA